MHIAAETLNALQAFRKRHADARIANNAAKDQPAEVSDSGKATQPRLMYTNAGVYRRLTLRDTKAS